MRKAGAAWIACADAIENFLLSPEGAAE